LLKKWLREPLLHFLFIGGVLFVTYNLQNEGVVESNRIVINEAEIDRMITLWEKKRQRLPTQEELQGLIEQQVREQVMYREAIAMGLDKNDSIVRRRLAQKVEFISSDLAELVKPSEAELENYLATHKDQFERPAKMSFVQIYIDPNKHLKKYPDKHADDDQDYAKRLLTKLKQADSSVDIKTVGDPLMLKQQYDQVSEYDIARLFGKNFASQLFSLPTGSWQGVISSGYGDHLVRIDHKVTARLPKLESVRSKVRDEWQAEQRRLMNEAFYKSLRLRYDIVIEKTPNENSPEKNKPETNSPEKESMASAGQK